MTIGQFAQSTGLSAKALRLYDEMGLLVPAEVDALNGYRRYRPDQIRRGAQLAVLRRMSVPLELAAQVLADPDQTERLLDEHATRVAERHAAERDAITAGRRLLASYDRPIELQRRQAARQPWVGAVIDLGHGPDAEPREPDLQDSDADTAFGALHQALTSAGIAVTGPWWTTLTISDDERSVRLVLCWPVAELPEADFTVPGLRLATGVLPERREALVEIRYDDAVDPPDDHVMSGIPVAAALQLEEQLGEDEELVGASVRQVGLLDAEGMPVGVELIVTTAVLR